jgi:hypothetical protein
VGGWGGWVEPLRLGGVMAWGGCLCKTCNRTLELTTGIRVKALKQKEKKEMLNEKRT